MGIHDRDYMRQDRRSGHDTPGPGGRRPWLTSPFLWIGLALLVLLALAALILWPNDRPDSPPPIATQEVPFPIDLNSAPPEELAQIPGVGPVLAMRIVSARPFSEISDLIHVQGIGERTLFKIAPYLSLSPPPEPAPDSTPEFPDIVIPSP